MNQRHSWQGLTSIICVESWVEKRGKTTYSVRHYLCSLAMTENAAKCCSRSLEPGEQAPLGTGVLMREDLARNREGNSAHNLAIIRHFATNLLHHDRSNKHSLKVRRKQAAWSTDYLAEILKQEW